MKNYTLELTQDELDLLNSYVPAITLQNITPQDAVKVGTIILDLQLKLEKLYPEKDKTSETVDTTEEVASWKIFSQFKEELNLSILID